MRRRGGKVRDERSPSASRETWLSPGTGTSRQRPDDLTVALCYPAAYPLGMSNLGFQTALGLFRGRSDVYCERAFRDESGWDGPGGRDGLSHETSTPLSDFDVIAFSVSFEDDYLNMAAVLHAARVPLVAAERSDDDPLVVMGGVCAHLNPEPVSPFLDAVLVGDAEALVGPFVESVRGSRGLPRADRLQRLVAVEGSYVPSLYEPTTDAAGRLTGFTHDEGVPLPVRAATGASSMAATSVLSDGAFFRDMLLLETSRGCGRGCRFCAAGSVLRPRVARPASEVLAAIESASSATSRVGLVTAALLDHPEAAEILRGAVKLGVEINVSSIRAEAVTEELAGLLREAGVKTVTLAPETGPEDLRRVLGKPTTDEELFRAIDGLAGAGMETLKLYFMVGVPGESEDDVRAIPELVRLARSRFVKGRSGSRVSVSVSSFVPKPRTAFQWLPMADEVYLRKQMAFLRKAFIAKPRIEFSGMGPREARREGLLARGGRDLSDAIRMAALDRVPWKAAVKRAGVDVADVLGRKRGADEVFPWEVVEVGTPREKLASSLAQAQELLKARG